MTKAPTAAVSLVMVAGMCCLGASPAAGDSVAAAPSDETTVVRILAGGVLQVATPDDGSFVFVGRDRPDSVNVEDLTHPMEAVAPCEVREFDEVFCPRDQVSSVLVLTGSGSDTVKALLDIPIVISTGPGNDTAIDIRSPEAHLIMGPGDDGVRPRFGAIDVLGGPGEDSVSYYQGVSNPDDVVVALDDIANDGTAPQDDNVHSDVEEIFSDGGDDLLIGSNAANTIDGGQGDDLMFGLGGDDQFVSFFANINTGADSMFGGAGTDTVSYADRFEQGVIVRLDDLAFDGEVGEGDNVHSDIENIIGSDSSDVLTGSSANNAISAGEGNDLIDGGPGADTVNGGDGVDSITYVDRATDLAVSLDGVANDGAAGELDNVAADLENITGGSGRDTLTGNDAKNILLGEGGRDVLSSLGGNDLLDGGLGADEMFGGPGRDTVTYEARVSRVIVRLDALANDGQQGELDRVRGLENVIGGRGNDLLLGDDDRNVLRGLLGDDTLRGQGGNDLLVGEAGNDRGNGGAGTDTCQTETRVNCP
jgi:Ca2+-binding RTX toxin-like protein